MNANTYFYKELTNQKRYFQVVAVDSNKSEVPATASAIVDGGYTVRAQAGQIIANETITYDLIQQGNKPPIVWTQSTLPPVSNYQEGQLLYWTVDKKLYRNDGSQWKKEIATSDLEGQITTTQISDNAITTPKIATNSITSDKITANAITSGHIQAGAITSDKIASNSILAKHIAITDFSNIYDDKFWITGQATGNYYADGTYSVVAVAGYPYKYAMYLQNTSIFYYQKDFACEAGKYYYLDAYLESGANAPDGLFGLQFFDYNNSLVSEQYITVIGNSNVQRVSNIFQAPTNAIKMRVVFKTSDGQPNNWYITGISLRKAMEGSLIVDGAITSNHIQAGTIITGGLVVNQYVRGGSKLSYGNANAGFYFRYDGIVDIGNSSSYLRWNGSNLYVKGNVEITGGLGIGNFSDAGSLATKNAVDWQTEVLGTGKPDDYANKAELDSTGRLQLSSGNGSGELVRNDVSSGSFRITLGKKIDGTIDGQMHFYYNGAEKISIGKSLINDPDIAGQDAGILVDFSTINYSVGGGFVANSIGVYGKTTGTVAGNYAVLGHSLGSGFGVRGISENGFGVYGDTSSTDINKAGVKGYATSTVGVQGESQNGWGVWAKSQNSYALAVSAFNYNGIRLYVGGSSYRGIDFVSTCIPFKVPFYSSLPSNPQVGDVVFRWASDPFVGVRYYMSVYTSNGWKSTELV